MRRFTKILFFRYSLRVKIRGKKLGISGDFY